MSIDRSQYFPSQGATTSFPQTKVPSPETKQIATDDHGHSIQALSSQIPNASLVHARGTTVISETAQQATSSTTFTAIRDLPSNKVATQAEQASRKVFAKRITAAESSSVEPKAQRPQLLRTDRAPLTNLKSIQQKKSEFYMSQIKTLSTALKALPSSTSDQFHIVDGQLRSIEGKTELIKKQIQQQATALLEELNQLSLPIKKGLQSEISLLKSFAESESPTITDNALSADEKNLMLEVINEMLTNKGSIGMELLLKINKTPSETLTKIWKEYGRIYLNSPDPTLVPFASLGLAFKNRNKDFEANVYTSLATNDPIIKTALAVEENHRSTPKYLEGKLNEMQEQFGTAKTSIDRSLTLLEKIFQLDPKLAAESKRTLSEAETTLSSDVTVEKKKVQLNQANTTFKEKHREMLEIIENKIAAASPEAQRKYLAEIKKAFPEYNTAQYPTWLHIRAQLQTPAFTDTMFEHGKTITGIQNQLQNINPNYGLESFT